MIVTTCMYLAYNIGPCCQPCAGHRRRCTVCRTVTDSAVLSAWDEKNELTATRRLPILMDAATILHRARCATRLRTAAAAAVLLTTQYGKLRKMLLMTTLHRIVPLYIVRQQPQRIYCVAACGACTHESKQQAVISSATWSRNSHRTAWSRNAARRNTRDRARRC